MMTPVLFVGPSLDPESRRSLAGVEVLPPVGRGDIDSLFARERPPKFVGIVDGVFLQTLAVSPKEILTAMERHEAVFFGSSSIGALRAVELADYGMRGVGDIVEMFAGIPAGRRAQRQARRRPGAGGGDAHGGTVRAARQMISG